MNIPWLPSIIFLGYFPLFCFLIFIGIGMVICWRSTASLCFLCGLVDCILDSYILLIKTVKGVCYKPFFCLSHWYQIPLHIIYTDTLFWRVEVLFMCRLPLCKITKSLVSSWELTERQGGILPFVPFSFWTIKIMPIQKIMNI